MPLTRTALLSCVALLALLAMPGPAQPPPPQRDPPPPKQPPRVDHLGDPLPPGALARLGTTRFRQNGTIQFVGYSGDGKTLMAASTDQTLRFWEAGTGKELRRLPVKTSDASLMRFGISRGPSVALSGDGKTLALGLDTGECTLVDVASGKTLRTFKTAPEQDKNIGIDFGGEVARFTLAHNGRTLMALDRGRFRPDGSKLRLWDTTTGKLVRQLNPKDGSSLITAAALSRDGQTVLVVDGPHPDRKADKPPPPPKGQKMPKEPGPKFRLLSVATGTLIRSIEGAPGTTSAVRFAPDGKNVVAAGEDGTIRLLEAATGKERTRMTGKPGQALDVFFSPSGTRVFTVGPTEVTLWDLRSGQELRRFQQSAEPADNRAKIRFGPDATMPAPPTALSPDGHTLALPAQATVALWDVETGKRLSVSEGHRDRIDSVAFSPKGDSLLTGSGDSTLALWDIRTGKRKFELTKQTPDAGPPNQRFGPEQFDLFRVRGGFSPDGKSIAGLWWHGRVHLWDAASGKLRHHLGEATAMGYTAFAFAPGGRAVAANGLGGSVVFWDTATGKQSRQFTWMPKEAPLIPGTRMEGGIFTLSFSDDGRVLLGGAMLIEPRGLRVLVDGWELASGRKRVALDNRMSFADGPGSIDEIARALDSFVVSFLFSPDGKLVAEVGFSTIKLRDFTHNKDLRVLGGRDVLASTATFSPDGKHLLAGQRDGTLRVWDVKTGEVLVDFPTQQGPVTGLAFSADGETLATGSKDTTVLLWDWSHVSTQAKPPKARPQLGKLKAKELVADLGGTDAARAYKAILALSAHPDEAIPLLKPVLTPGKPMKVEPGQVKKLLADLESKEAATRDKAEKELAELGKAVKKALEGKLAGKPAEDTTNRLKRLLARLEAGEMSATVLRAIRAIEVLERIATPAARRLLETAAAGPAGGPIPEEARAALGRLKKRAAGS
jgi:WD40 repeat protein